MIPTEKRNYFPAQNQLIVFTADTCYILCALQTGILRIIQVKFSPQLLIYVPLFLSNQEYENSPNILASPDSHKLTWFNNLAFSKQQANVE